MLLTDDKSSGTNRTLILAFSPIIIVEIFMGTPQRGQTVSVGTLGVEPFTDMNRLN
ncbi:hypothetical protein [Clostridium sp. Marseille-P2415]|uniref:hypothetical protein n=1 Tax=Clostridium sp. Marseille-P2415 TaxID=1805471 RepID=UPI0013562976|nr:hypothetical protein [Clostridium sp. Marseille-P2415]